MPTAPRSSPPALFNSVKPRHLDLVSLMKTTEPKNPLSRREEQIVKLLAQGLTNREIAQSLFLSPETVKTYVTRLLRKLGARNRTEAVSKAAPWVAGTKSPLPSREPDEALRKLSLALDRNQLYCADKLQDQRETLVK